MLCCLKKYNLLATPLTSFTIEHHTHERHDFLLIKYKEF